MRIFVLASLTLLAAGCSLNTDYFSEYRGKNILSNYGFDAVDTDGTTAKWALEAPESKLATSGTTASTFMTWEPAGVTGPDGTSPAYRLEIKNLIPDGDFEAETDGSTALGANWTATTGTDAVFNTTHQTNGSQTLSPSQTMTGRSLWWRYKNAGDDLVLDLKGAVGGTWPVIGSNYRFRIDYMNLLQLSLSLGLTGTTKYDWSPSSTAVTYLTLWTLSKGFEVDAAADPFQFQIGGTGFASSLLLDNAKLVPDISTLWVKTALPSIGSGALTLLPGSKSGMYVLTLQVKDDPQAGSGNHFNPSAVTVQLVAKVKSGTARPAPTVFTRPTAGWTTWTTLTVDAGFDFVTDDAAATGNALTIEITPTISGTDNVDAGSVLIAQPTLTFNP